MRLARSYPLVRRLLARRVVPVPPAATRPAAACSSRPVNMRPSASQPTCRDLTCRPHPLPLLFAGAGHFPGYQLGTTPSGVTRLSCAPGSASLASSKQPHAPSHITISNHCLSRGPWASIPFDQHRPQTNACYSTHPNTDDHPISTPAPTQFPNSEQGTR